MRTKIVIFVGVLTQYQGIDLLLEAIPLVVQSLQNVRFLIIGYPNEIFYENKARKMGISQWTYFTGKIRYEEVPRYLSLADVAVSPKISVTEGNLKLLPYMAMGLPTVVFDNPVNREILGDYGVYAKNVTAKSLAETLLEILCDDDLAKYLGNQCRLKAIDHYSWLVVGKRIREIYDSAFAGGML